MTQHRDIESLLDRWLGEGSTVAPDRVIDVVADRIEHQRQRPAWRFLRREPNVSTNLKLAAGVAALAILGAGALYLAGPRAPGVGGPNPTPSTAPTPSPVPSASPRTISSTTFRPALRLELPDGWVVTDGVRALTLNTAGTAGSPAGAVEFKPKPVVGSNANACEGLAATGVGTSVAEIVTALAADTRLAVVAGSPVTLDGRTGQVLDLRVAAGWAETCSWSGGQPAALLLTVADPPGPFLGLIGDERMRVILVDVDGVAVAIAFSATDGATFDAFVAAAMPIVETVRFTP
jgi:hypothetical protein